MKRFTCVTAALCFCLANAARADYFVPDYSGWASLSAEAKAGAMIGMADFHIDYADGDSELRKATSVGAAACFRNLQLKAAALANAVESWYRADDTRKAAPLQIAFHGAVIVGLCWSFVEPEIRKVQGGGTPT